LILLISFKEKLLSEDAYMKSISVLEYWFRSNGNNNSKWDKIKILLEILKNLGHINDSNIEEFKVHFDTL